MGISSKLLGGAAGNSVALWQNRVFVCVNFSLKGRGKTSRVTELMQMELAFISPCSILCGRHLHFPKASSSLPVPQANPELYSRGKPFHTVRGDSPELESGELKTFEKEYSYFKAAIQHSRGQTVLCLSIEYRDWYRSRPPYQTTTSG